MALLLAGDAWRYSAGWVVFSVLAVAVGGYSAVLLVARRATWHVGRLPLPLLAFLALATLSIAWSFYPAATALGLVTTWLITAAALAIAITASWAEILWALSAVLRWILALSFAFELIVSLVVGRPILPFQVQPGVDYTSYDKIPDMLFWSRNELFDVFGDGRIQGIVGNANHLGFLALLALITVAAQLADKSIRARSALPWATIAVLALLFTRSATVTVALVGVLATAIAVLLVRRATSAKGRVLTYAGIAGVLLAAGLTVLALQDKILLVLGKSPDFTGRFGIWSAVIDLAQERTAFGWGWVSFWMPWAAPFDTLVFRNGVRQLQAHNAWLDVWLQLGLVGVVLLAALVISTLVRSWLTATDRPPLSANRVGPHSALTLFPLLVLVALLVQSLAESRLLVEFGWALLVLIAVKSRRGDHIAAAVKRD